MTGHEYMLKYQKELRDNPTRWEIKILGFLKELGIYFEFQKIVYTPNGSYIVDFYLPQFNIAIECDGKQHYTKINRNNDTIRDRNLRIYKGVKTILRFKNTKITTMSVNTFRKHLDRVL